LPFRRPANPGSGIVASGREQDFKVGWPSSIMFADPTRSVPFVFVDK
jgi:hypothetical protein